MAEDGHDLGTTTSLLGQAATTEGESSSMKKLVDTVAFARDVAHFSPDVIIIDGFDFTRASEAMIEALATIARDYSAELWISTTTKASQPNVAVFQWFALHRPMRAARFSLCVFAGTSCLLGAWELLRSTLRRQGGDGVVLRPCSCSDPTTISPPT